MSAMVGGLDRDRTRAPVWLGLVLMLAAVAFIIASVVRTDADPAPTRPARTGPETVSPSAVYPAEGREDFHGGVDAPGEHDGVRGHPVRRG
jgi:hypothetical protein